jgi:UDP-N-acetylmuramoylalanine--D-glutamate ligase
LDNLIGAGANWLGNTETKVIIVVFCNRLLKRMKLNTTDLNNKKIVIVGLGTTGLSCLKFLSDRGISPVVIDTREAPRNIDEIKAQYTECEFILGGLPQEKLLAADIVLLSPGVSKQTSEIQVAIDAGVEVFCDVELFARLNSKPVVAITGSNGKSTVTMWVTEMLNCSGVSALAGGNIGVPVLELLTADADVLVLELSSFQLETVQSLKPVAATILNISDDHLDRYQGSLTLYAEAKQRIYHNAVNCIFNSEDPLTQPLQSDATKWCFDANGFKPVSQTSVGFSELPQQVAAATKKIKGSHNEANAQVSALIALLAGADQQGIVQALESFGGLPHRTEWVADKLGAHWINDSKATNVGSTLAAINGLYQSTSGELIIIAGGDGKGADFSPLQTPLNDKVKQLITLGKDGAAIGALKADSIHVSDLNEAVSAAAKIVSEGDIVLLSPACASLDMFVNFEQRGNLFREAVEAL